MVQIAEKHPTQCPVSRENSLNPHAIALVQDFPCGPHQPRRGSSTHRTTEIEPGHYHKGTLVTASLLYMLCKI